MVVVEDFFVANLRDDIEALAPVLAYSPAGRWLSVTGAEIRAIQKKGCYRPNSTFPVRGSLELHCSLRRDK